MEKLFGWILILVIMYVAVTLYTEGADEAFGGVFGVLSPTTASEAEELLSHTSAYTEDVPDGSSRKAVPITDAIRDRVAEHAKTAADRHRNAQGR